MATLTASQFAAILELAAKFTDQGLEHAIQTIIDGDPLDDELANDLWSLRETHEIFIDG